MDTLDRITTKVEVREFSGRPVPPSVKLKILEAGRMTGSSMNKQHWRFLVLQERESISRLAEDSTTGKWVGGSSFAIVILTNPAVPVYLLDVGRALQDMQLAAWDQGVGSGIFTGFDVQGLRKDFGIPDSLTPAAGLGFGYPKGKVTGKGKSRKPLGEVAFAERFGRSLDPARDLR